MDNLPVIVSLVVAILGAIGGLAAVLKVNADNSNTLAGGAKSVSEGAKTVVDMMVERMDEQDARVESIELYVAHFDVWADRLIDILDRAITLLPDAMRKDFEIESRNLKHTRPNRRIVRGISDADEK